MTRREPPITRTEQVTPGCLKALRVTGRLSKIDCFCDILGSLSPLEQRFRGRTLGLEDALVLVLTDPDGPNRSAVTGEERDDLTDRPPTRGADLQRHAPGLEDEEATDKGGVVVGAGGTGHRMVGLGRRMGQAGLLGVQQPGDPVESGRDHQDGGLAPADLHPDLEPVVLPVTVGPRVGLAAQVWDQQRPDGKVGPSGRYGSLSSPDTPTVQLWQSRRRGLGKLAGGAAVLVVGLVVTAAAAVWPDLAAELLVQAASNNTAAPHQPPAGRGGSS